MGWLLGGMDLNMRNSRLERLGRYVRWRSTQLASLAGLAQLVVPAAAQASRGFSVVAQEYEVKKRRLRLSNVEADVCKRVSIKIHDLGGAREPDATVQPLNDSAVAVTEMQCNGRTGSFVSTPRAATGTGVYQFHATPTMISGCRMEKRGRRDRFESRCAGS